MYAKLYPLTYFGNNNYFPLEEGKKNKTHRMDSLSSNYEQQFLVIPHQVNVFLRVFTNYIRHIHSDSFIFGFAHQLFHLFNLCWNWFSSFNEYSINPIAMLPDHFQCANSFRLNCCCIDHNHRSKCTMFNFYGSWTLNKNNEQTFTWLIQLICHTSVCLDWNVNRCFIFNLCFVQ